MKNLLVIPLILLFTSLLIGIQLNDGYVIFFTMSLIIVIIIFLFIKIKDLEHHRDTLSGLYATDKEPEKLFEEVFVNLSSEIGMDGNQTFSPQDYDYYKTLFNRGIKLLMFKID